MQGSQDSATDAPERNGDSPRDAALRERTDRLQALRSVWGVLAPSVLRTEQVESAIDSRERTPKRPTRRDAPWTLWSGRFLLCSNPGAQLPVDHSSR